MRIAYVNAHYQQNHTGGGHVHMEQFIANAIALGHEVWVYPGHQYPGANLIPTSRMAHIRAMRQMDALYVRVEGGFPEVCKWSLPPRRRLYNFPVVVWEFNTIPEHSLLRGGSEKYVQESIQSFKQYGRGCNLAICMTNDLANYVQQKFGITRVLIVPNGSDPILFQPGLPIVSRMNAFRDKFNIVWVGSGKEPWHDLRMIKEAARILINDKRSKYICFHIIGPDLNGLMGEMPENVFYWGAEYYNKLPGWLSCMDVGLSLYLSGPADIATPLKVFDYMASGLAVLSTPLPFMKQLANVLNQSDLIITPGDSEALATKIIELEKDKDRVKKLGGAGRQLVIDQYNWHRAVKDTMNEIENLLKSKSRHIEFHE